MEIGVIILGFMMCFGERGSDFYGLPWGREIHSSTVRLRQERGVERWKGRSQRNFVFISEAFTWGIIFQAPEDQRKLQSSARISIGGDDPR